ncbi:TonB-dependent siderophore receptor [Acinetobacter puyangensis]|uniref:TonB-dependent siderophore receptor n=1 Tax=Acinetobacter puyangensis TaxID=1096779 RepID=UPI003A4D7AF6
MNQSQNTLMKLGLKPMILSIHMILAAGVAITTQSAIANTAPAIEYNVAAGTLTQALNQFALQSGVKVSVDSQKLAGLHSSGLQGKYSVSEGFAELLKNSPYQIQKIDDGYTIVEKIKTLPTQARDMGQLKTIDVNTNGQLNSDANAVQLPVIVVDAEDETIVGGKIARKSRIGMLGDKDFMETPFSIIGYTSDYIQDLQAKDISSVITKTDPSVYANGSAGGINDNYNIRGFSVSPSDASINGLYGVAPYYRATPEFAERIDVLKGPSALLNGIPPGGSVGGTVNIVTKRARDIPTRRLTTTYDSDAKFGIHADLGQRFGYKQQFGIRFNGVYRDGDTAVDHQSTTSKFATLGVDWRFNRGSLSADFYHSKDHVDGLNRGISLANGLAIPKPPKATTVFAPPDTFTNTEDDVIILHGDYDITDQINVYAVYGHSKTDFDALAGSTQQIINVQGDFINNYSHQRFQYDKDSADLGIKFNFDTWGIKHIFTVNTTYYQHDYKFGFLRNMLGTDSSKYYVTNMYHPNWDGLFLDKSFSHATIPKTSEVKNTSYGFADSMSMFDGRLNIILGIRQQNVLQDTIDGTTGKRTARYDSDKITPAFAVSYKILENLALYGNYIEGLSLGSTAPATAENAGKVFPPYQTKQYEIGGKIELDDFTTTLSLFQIKKPSSMTDPVTNVFSFGGQQQNSGMEWGFFGKVLPELKIIVGISYTEAELTKTAGGVNQGKMATGVPKWQAKLGTEYEIPMLEGLSINANAAAMSSQYTNTNNTMQVAGRTIYDLGGHYKTNIRQIPIMIRADIKNVANKSYWASSTGSGLGAPRTFMLSTTFDF